MSIKIQIIGRGFNGWHAQGSNFRLSGGGLYPVAWWAGGVQHGYLEQAQDGALVYDAQAADEDLFTKHVIGGPLLDLGLQPWEWLRFTTRERIDYTPEIRDWNSKDFAPFDSIGIGIYERLLRSIPGIQIGRVRRGEVVCRGGMGLHTRADAVWIEWEPRTDEATEDIGPVTWACAVGAHEQCTSRECGCECHGIPET